MWEKPYSQELNQKSIIENSKEKYLNPHLKKNVTLRVWNKLDPKIHEKGFLIIKKNEFHHHKFITFQSHLKKPIDYLKYLVNQHKSNLHMYCMLGNLLKAQNKFSILLSNFGLIDNVHFTYYFDIKHAFELLLSTWKLQCEIHWDLPHKMEEEEVKTLTSSRGERPNLGLLGLEGVNPLRSIHVRLASNFFSFIY